MVLTHLDETAAGDRYRQVELTLRHPGCWTLAVTADFSGTHLIERSLYPTSEAIKGDFTLIARGPADIESVVEAIDGYAVVNDVAVVKRSDDRARAVVIYDRQSSIVPAMVNSGFMPIEPVHITGGRECWTLLVRASELSDVVNEMEAGSDVEITSIQEVDPEECIAVPDLVDRVHDDLSARQREVLHAANEAGYYHWPREVSACDVAEDTGISESTFLEHIRMGEHKILRAVFEELEHRHPRR